MRVCGSHVWLILTCLLVVVPPQSACAALMSKAPANIQAALLMKLLAQNKQINNGGSTGIYVIGNTSFTAAMKPVVGRKLGKGKLSSVKEAKVPTDKIEGLMAIYVGDPKQWEAVKAYCRKYKVLSITGLPELVEKGVTLSIGVAKKKPKVILDMAAAKAEGAEWDPAVMKVATLINKD